MSAVFDTLYSWLIMFTTVMSYFRFIDFIDIIFVAFLLYKLMKLVIQTRAKQLVVGLIIIFGAWILARWSGMTSINWILQNFMAQGIVIIAIIFQPELRSVLEHVSRSNPVSRIGFNAKSTSVSESIDNVCKACQSFQTTKTGALIVFERSTMLGDIINTGTIIDADANTELICNIFYPNTPLHDGAMIIRDGRIYAAGCILPLTKNNALEKELGTRHRASLGMSECSDAVVIVVSEETGTISVAVDGSLMRGFNNITLKELLTDKLIQSSDDDTTKSLDKIKRFMTFRGGKKNDGQN